jgi:hypothetical protein
MKNSYSLIRGCALFNIHHASANSYLLGTLDRVGIVTSPHQRSALAQLANNKDPFANIPAEYMAQLEDFIATLDAHGFLNHRQGELAPPKRNLEAVASRDRAFIQLRTRSTPELAQIEWRERGGDGGTATLAARSEFPIELSGRSRTITLLYSILLASGVTQVHFSDRFLNRTVGDLDIGFGPLTTSDIGLDYYQQLERHRRGLSLFPIALNEKHDEKHDERHDEKHGEKHGEKHESCRTQPALTVHYGDCDPELLVEWAQARRPHLVIHAPVGDEIAIGPLVLPGKSPCLRCLSLYEIDHWGYTKFERISLNQIDDLPVVVAYFIAAAIAQQVLAFIDHHSNENFEREILGIGEVSYINFQRLTSPQVVAIARHPLCGCDR